MESASKTTYCKPVLSEFSLGFALKISLQANAPLLTDLIQTTLRGSPTLKKQLSAFLQPDRATSANSAWVNGWADEPESTRGFARHHRFGKPFYPQRVKPSLKTVSVQPGWTLTWVGQQTKIPVWSAVNTESTFQRLNSGLKNAPTYLNHNEGHLCHLKNCWRNLAHLDIVDVNSRERISIE